jgi:hypothetical protein
MEVAGDSNGFGYDGVSAPNAGGDEEDDFWGEANGNKGGGDPFAGRVAQPISNPYGGGAVNPAAG